MQEKLQTSLEAIKAIETAGRDYYIFHLWEPESLGIEDQVYVSPIAHETAVGALLSDNLPARILIHGPSGNGKSRLLRQIWNSFSAQVGLLHQATCLPEARSPLPAQSMETAISSAIDMT